jgi:outer membrane protein OmpA-like peptidoglycan-associated protein
MSLNLLDAVKGYFSSDLINKASSMLGESEGGITKALSGIVPSVLGGLLSKSSAADGAGSLLNMAKEAHGSGILGSLGDFFGENGSSLLSKGADLLKGLFGDKADGIVNGVASMAGIKGSSVSSLMSMAAPVALGTLGKHVTENNLDAGGLASFLTSQKSSILSNAPSFLSGLLGLGSLSGAASNATDQLRGAATTAAHYAEDAAQKGGAIKWLLPLLLLALAAAGAWYFMKGCNSSGTAGGAGHDTISAVQGSDTIKVSDSNKNANVTIESIKVKLKDGTELTANKGGIEDMLVNFLNDANAKVDTGKGSKGNWFSFDNLNFKTGSADLTAESMAQVSNIAAILKAYPSVQIKIGGYTDKTGKEEDNKKLSQSRAEAVAAAIKKAGGNAAQVTDAEGYGSEFAVAAATAPDEERKKDRKIAVRVKAK